MISQIIHQCVDGIIGGTENISVRPDIIADQANHNFVRFGTFFRTFQGFSDEIQNVMSDIVKAIDQKLRVLDHAACLKLIQRGKPLAGNIFVFVAQHLIVAVPQ